MITCKILAATVLCIGNLTYQEVHCVTINGYSLCTDIKRVDDECSQDTMLLTYQGVKLEQAVKLIEAGCVEGTSNVY